jgi:hypothetical protein
MSPRRWFGRLRQLPSGRWQARYPGPDGQDRAAPTTFATKTEAARWLSLVESELSRQTWIDPGRGRLPLRTYAEAWVAERPELRPKTLELYRSLLRRHVLPLLGEVPLMKITTERVRVLAQRPVGRRSAADDHGQGVPAAAGHPRHRCRRRADRAQPVPDQGRQQ